MPPWYRSALAKSSVQHVVAQVSAVRIAEPTGSSSAQRPIIATLTAPKGAARTCTFDRIVLGTGSAPDCLAIPLVAAIHAKWPIDIIGGYPAVEQGLRWSPEVPIYVTGGLASLRVGPTATNLMGARQCASDIADELGVYDSLDEPEVYSVHSNKFSALFSDSSDDDSESSDQDE